MRLKLKQGHIHIATHRAVSDTESLMKKFKPPAPVMMLWCNQGICKGLNPPSCIRASSLGSKP